MDFSRICSGRRRFSLAAQIAVNVSARLLFEEPARGRLFEPGRAPRILKRAMREGVMIALDSETNADRSAVIPPYSEAHRVRAVAGGEPGTTVPRVTGIAEPEKRSSSALTRARRDFGKLPPSNRQAPPEPLDRRAGEK